MATDSKSSSTTTDHDEIRRWVEEHGGRPTTVKGTGKDGAPGLLRIDFQDADEELEPIEWDAFFEKFDSDNLAFLHGEGDSRFNKFVRQ